MKQKKRKLLLTGVTAVLCLTVLLTGTFAWSSLSQVALNEVNGTINSGGRLHDDFDGSSNKDIYVENYTAAPGTDLIVRVRLREYMEIAAANGTTYRSAPTLGKEDRVDWPLYELPSAGLTKSGDEVMDQESDHFDAAHPYCQWTFGGSTVYVPTANQDNTSQEPDLNGTSANQYADYKTYSVGDTGARKTLTGTVVSLTQWQNELNSECGAYWIYDDSADGDGWFYWGQRLAAGTATGLLLSGIRMNLPDDESATVYYGIYVESQMVTPGEVDVLADRTNTGGGGVSERAGTLLEKLLENATLSIAVSDMEAPEVKEKTMQQEIQEIYEEMLAQEKVEEEAEEAPEEEPENEAEPEEPLGEPDWEEGTVEPLPEVEEPEEEVTQVDIAEPDEAELADETADSEEVSR